MTSQLLRANELKEGDIFCRWLKSRLISKNKNVLGVELGATGSGKSYRDLRKAELWYDFYFHEKFPTENICFGIREIMERITSGKLRRGEVIIFEEAGANLGSLDFQNKICKMFTYVLQSFRSMNIGIFFNLPYFSMLNKNARTLMHYSSESIGIDTKTKINKCKFFMHQVSQKSGKIYLKYPKINYRHVTKKVKKFGYEIPAKYLIDAYESKKAKYLMDSTNKYLDKIVEMEEKENKPKKELTETQKKILELKQKGLKQTEIAKILGKYGSDISKNCKWMKNKGFAKEMKFLEPISTNNPVTNLT